MFARRSRTHANPVPVSAVILTLAALSLATVPAHGFDLKPSWEEGMKAVTDDLNALGEKGLPENGKSPAREGIDRDLDRLAGQAADKAERGMFKLGEKAWKGLEKTKTLGSTMKKLGKRWGAAARMGTRISPHVGTALTVWDFGYAVGKKLIAPKVVAAIERRFENKWREQEEELRRETEHYRSLGEQRRQWKETVSSMRAVGLAMKKLREDKKGPWATTDDPWGEDTEEAHAAPRDSKDPGAKNDPWAAETPDFRSRQPVAMQAAPVPVKEVETGPSNYEKALNALQGGGTQSAGYEKALEKLETDRRAELARREAEAETARQRELARWAEERRHQAERAAEAERNASIEKRLRQQTLERAARERERQQTHERAARERQQTLERAARQRREYNRRSYNNSLQQLNRNMQTLQQTRRQQQRAYQQQNALDLQRQRQRQLEQARRQQIYEQQRARDRQTYQPVGRRSGSDPVECDPRCGCNNERGCTNVQ